MPVGFFTTFRANRKEPLAALLERIHSAFQKCGESLPAVHFAFADSTVGDGISCVDRVQKRFPEMERFLSTVEIVPGQLAYRQLSNQVGTAGEGEDVEFETILRIAEGVPRSYPFHGITIHFTSPQFGVLPADTKPPLAMASQLLQSGVVVGDHWWASGRLRSVQSLPIATVPTMGRKLPPLPDLVEAVFTARGKPRKLN